MLEDVKRTLEKYRDDLAEQFKDKNENYAYDRIKNAQVYTRGDYAFLIAVNSLTPGSTATPCLMRTISWSPRSSTNRSCKLTRQRAGMALRGHAT